MKKSTYYWYLSMFIGTISCWAYAMSVALKSLAGRLNDKSLAIYEVGAELRAQEEFEDCYTPPKQKIDLKPIVMWLVLMVVILIFAFVPFGGHGHALLYHIW